VTGEADDLTDPQGTEPVVGESLGGWGSTSAEPTWGPTAEDGDAAGSGGSAGSAAAGPAGPGEAAASPASPASPADAAASGPNPYAGGVPPSDAPTLGGRTRRPTSLRSSLDESAAQAPRRPVPPSPPPFEAAAPPREVPSAATNPAEPAESTGSPFDPVFERLATAQERAAVLASERPEVVVGVAFVGGLILATILKRFGRR
jgi:hypothetical protein